MKETMNFMDKIVARHMRFTGLMSYAKIAKSLKLKPSTVKEYLKPIEAGTRW